MNVRIHVAVLAITALVAPIGIRIFGIGPLKLVILPMLHALLLGLFAAWPRLKVLGREGSSAAGPMVSVTLLVLMAKYGTLAGPSLPKLLAVSPALVMQEFGNLGAILLGVPAAVLLFGFGRETIGAAHSIAREPNLSLIADRFGLDSAEGRGVVGVYLTGTLLGTVVFSVLASLADSLTPLDVRALAMASGVGSASMMTAAIAALTSVHSDIAADLAALGAASNMLSGFDGVFLSVFLWLPLAERLYARVRRIREGWRK